MTNQEMEVYLIQSAAKLPDTMLPPDFLWKNETTTLKTGTKKSWLRTAILSAAILILIMGSVTAYNRASYGMWVVPFGSTLDGTHYKVSGHRFELPRELGDLVYETERKYSVVPLGTPFWQAIFTPRYQPISVYYGSENSVSISVGVTDNECWQTYFSYTEELIPDYASRKIPTTDLGRTEYRGHEIFCYQQEELICATWVDEKLGLCFDLTAWDATITLETVLSYANTVIDINTDE